MVIVSYDVCTEDSCGRRRLRHIAKLCLNHGQRVQYSVFECEIDSSQLLLFRDKLLKEIDFSRDSLRIYCLGNRQSAKIEHYGTKKSLNLGTDPLLF